MRNFWKRIFGMNNSSAENVEQENLEQSVEARDERRDVFFNTPQNSLLADISQALSDGRHDTLKALVKNYRKDFGKLSHDDFFYRYDKVANEWYMCAPLYKWCCDLETRDLFRQLCDE